MLIGELSRRSGLSRDTIRFYEKNGLIQVTRGERRDNNYKEYSEDVLKKLLAVKRIKGFGFTLREIADILQLMEINEATCDKLEETISSKIEWIDEQIRLLNATKMLLLSGIQRCQSSACTSTNDTKALCRALDEQVAK